MANKITYRSDRVDNLLSIEIDGIWDYDLIINYGEQLIEELKGSEHLRKKIFSLFVEMGQNIKNYSLEKENGMGIGLFSLKETISHFILMSKNLANLEQLNRIHERVNIINACNKEDLTALFRKERRRAIEENMESGNVGLIDMSIKSNNPLLVETTTENEAMYMCLTIKVDKQ